MAIAIRESCSWTGVALGCLISFASVPAVGQDRLSDHILVPVGWGDASFFVSPTPGAERMRFLLTLIARSARVPIGFEEVAGVPTPYDGDLSKIPLSARTYLLGLTVGEALNALVSADPRYSWREQDGLILIRPAETWRDPVSFLYQEVAGFRLVDATASDVAEAIYKQLRVPTVFGEGGVIGMPPDPGTDLKRHMVFDVHSGSVLDALNAVVRAHGGLGWMVHYSRAPAEAKTSCIRFLTFSGYFSGVGAAECQANAGIERKGDGKQAPSNMHQTALRES